MGACSSTRTKGEEGNATPALVEEKSDTAQGVSISSIFLQFVDEKGHGSGESNEEKYGDESDDDEDKDEDEETKFAAQAVEMYGDMVLVAVQKDNETNLDFDVFKTRFFKYIDLCLFGGDRELEFRKFVQKAFVRLSSTDIQKLKDLIGRAVVRKAVQELIEASEKLSDKKGSGHCIIMKDNRTTEEKYADYLRNKFHQEVCYLLYCLDKAGRERDVKNPQLKVKVSSKELGATKLNTIDELAEAKWPSKAQIQQMTDIVGDRGTFRRIMMYCPTIGNGEDLHVRFVNKYRAYAARFETPGYDYEAEIVKVMLESMNFGNDQVDALHGSMMRAMFSGDIHYGKMFITMMSQMIKLLYDARNRRRMELAHDKWGCEFRWYQESEDKEIRKLFPADDVEPESDDDEDRVTHMTFKQFGQLYNTM